MKAARFHGREDVRIEDVEPSTVGPDEVRVDVDACGVCGSDIHEYEVGPHLTPPEPNPVTGAAVPVPMGHEFSGVVSERGDGVTSFREGDPVTVHPNIPCHDCLYCEEGSYNLCANTVAIGFETGTGGFAESAVVPAGQVHRLPDAVPVEAGALVEPLAVGLHAIRRGGLQAGDTVGVFGCGPIGLTVVSAAANAGARRVFVSEPNDARREVAHDLGADVGLDPVESDPVERIREETADGVTHAFEFAGIGPAFNAAVRSTRRGGTVTVGSIADEDVTTDLNDIVTTERTIEGTYTYGYPPTAVRTEFGAVVESLAAGEIDTDAFVTGRIDLGEIGESGFEELRAPDTEHVKILVRP